MPSGGLVAMGNVRAFARDLGAGFLGLARAQIAFLVRARARYDVVVAVGDAYALGLALLARRPTVFVGTAKSAYVAPYGPFERSLLRRARVAFVRDARTAEALAARGTAASAPGNVIVDLVDDAPAALPGRFLALAPGSREEAYADAVRLARVIRALGAFDPEPRALLSIAPTLDADRFARALAGDGWSIGARAGGPAAFVARASGAEIVGWSGSFGALLRASVAVVGQAGTANEQGAAFGLPIFALAGKSGGRDWYRMRQRRLLGDALALLPPEPDAAARALADALADPARLARMRAAGRERMGDAGGAATIARVVAELAA